MNLTEATILLVDDEPVLLEIFALWLASAGCRIIRTAQDGEAALAILKSASVDLLVTDIRMPIMDGITLVRRVGEMDTSLPSIIFISGFGEVDQKEMYALGAQAFLPKPITRKDFIAVVEKALAERSALWLTPLEDPPRQSVMIQVEDAEDIAMEQKFRLGRGGFCAHCAGVLGLGAVRFRCEIPPKPLETERHEIAGEGYVRWHSTTDQKVGIEFAFLEGPSRTWLLEEIASTKPRSFIPNS